MNTNVLGAVVKMTLRVKRRFFNQPSSHISLFDNAKYVAIDDHFVKDGGLTISSTNFLRWLYIIQVPIINLFLVFIMSLIPSNFSYSVLSNLLFNEFIRVSTISTIAIVLFRQVHYWKLSSV